MVWPKVSIIWLNHNSSRFINVVFNSLESVINLDYPSDRYELIVVDNGSTDGSFEKIKEFLESRGSIKKKIIRLEKNLGFTGGNNIGYAARDKESKYVLLLNNDAMLRSEGLKTLVEYLEKYNNVGSVQGVVLKYKSNLIDTAGDFVDELLQSFAAGSGESYPWILKRPIYITYADGCCALYRVNALKRCCGESIFIDEFFGYGDDNVLGLMLWNIGYASIAIKYVVAEHFRGFTFGRASNLSQYLILRNRIALAQISNSRYKSVIMAQLLRWSVFSFRWGMGKKYVGKVIARGLKFGEFLKRKGLFIDLYKAVLIKIDPIHIPLFFSTRKIVRKYYKEWFIKNLDKLQLDE